MVKARRLPNGRLDAGMGKVTKSAVPPPSRFARWIHRLLGAKS